MTSGSSVNMQSKCNVTQQVMLSPARHDIHCHHSHTICSFFENMHPIPRHMLIFTWLSMDFNTPPTPNAHFRILDPPLDPSLDASLETSLDPALDAPLPHQMPSRCGSMFFGLFYGPPTRMPHFWERPFFKFLCRNDQYYYYY